MTQGQIFRRGDLVPAARPVTVDELVQDQDQGGAGSDDFLTRVDSILKSLDSMLGKYYFGQQGGQMGSGQGNNPVQDQGAGAGAIDVDSMAGAVFDALRHYMGQIPFADRMSVEQLGELMEQNRGQLVREIAKGLLGAVRGG